MDKFNYLKEQLTAALATWQQTNGGKTTVGWMHAANPEVIAALLAELEAKDKRIAELEEEFAFIMGQNDGMEKELRDKDARIEHLEAKLATPVRLPDMRQSSSGDRYQWSDGVHNYRLDVISMLLGAGLTVAVEGDE